MNKKEMYLNASAILDYLREKFIGESATITHLFVVTQTNPDGVYQLRKLANRKDIEVLIERLPERCMGNTEYFEVKAQGPIQNLIIYVSLLSGEMEDPNVEASFKLEKD